RLKLLTFMRELLKIPEEPLKLRFFDEHGVKLQHLKDLHAKYEPLFDRDSAAARKLLENWLLSIQVGLTAVHKLREVDQDFDREYMLPQLKLDEGIGNFAEALVDTASGNGQPRSTGAKALLGDLDDGSAAPSVARTLLNLLTQSDKRIEVKMP